MSNSFSGSSLIPTFPPLISLIVNKEENNGTRSIWRIPTEVWRMIFAEATTVQEELPLSEYMDVIYEPPGFTSLHISAVCRRWRAIATGYGELWCNITVTWGENTDLYTSRIRHYHSLAGSRSKSLTMKGGRLLNRSFYSELQVIFKNDPHLDRFVCLVRPDAGNWINDALLHLPPVHELWLLAQGLRDANCHTHSPNPYHVSIPSNQYGAIKRLIADQVAVSWGIGLQLEELAFKMPLYSSHPAIPLYNRAFPITLKVLSVGHGIYGKLLQYRGSTLPHVHTIKTSLQILYFLTNARYSFPQLTTMEVTEDSSIEDDEWSIVCTSQNISGIHNLVIHSMCDELDEIFTYINDFTSLRRLEIRGESVDPLLDEMTDKYKNGNYIFGSLKEVTISSYWGTEESILSFMRACVEAEQPTLGNIGGGIKLRMQGCTDISLEIRRVLNELQMPA